MDNVEDEICPLYYSSYHLNENSSSSTCGGGNRTSRGEDLTFLLIGVPIPLLSIIVNLAVLLAAGLQRKTLRRHNYVFSSVCSALLSNVLYAVLSLWMAIANYFGFMERGIRQDNEDARLYSERWWILRNSTLICLLLAMCGNIGSLVFVLMDSTYFVGRTISHGSIDKSKFDSQNEKKRRCRFRLTKRKKAHLLIALSWLVPTLLVLLSSFTKWNCVKCCCPPGHYTADACAAEAGCSRFWPPVAQSFLGVFLGLWLIEVILMVWLLTYTSLRFRKIAKDRSMTASSDSGTNSAIKMDENGQGNNDPASCSEPQIRRQSLPGCDPASNEQRPEASFASDNTNRDKPSLASDIPINSSHTKSKSLSLRFIRKANSKMKSMMSLAAVFFIFTFPVVVGIIVDISTGSPMPGKNGLMVLGEVSTFLYTLICPVILLKFMPRLKLSVIMCMYKCCNVCKK